MARHTEPLRPHGAADALSGRKVGRLSLLLCLLLAVTGVSTEGLLCANKAIGFEASPKRWETSPGPENPAERFGPLWVYGYGVGSVEYSPDGCRLAAVGPSVVLILDAESYQIEKQLFAEDTLVTNSARWSPDGQYIAAGSSVPPRLNLWNVETGERLGSFVGHTQRVQAVAWSPDGSRLASATQFGPSELKIWDVRTGQVLRSLSGSDSVAWSPDGQYVAASNGEAVRIYDAASGDLVRTLPTPYSFVQAVAWSPDGQYVASGGYAPFDTTIKVWDVTTGLLLRILEHGGQGNAIAWSLDGTYLAAGGGFIRIWETEAYTAIRTLGEGQGLAISSVGWSPGGDRLAAGGVRIIKVWDVETGDSIATLQAHRGQVNSVTWSPDGRYIASGASAYLSDRSIRIWDRETGRMIRIIRDGLCGVGGFNSVAWSPDGRYLAASQCSWTRIWEVETGNEVRRFEWSVIYSLAWSPDGRYLASGGYDRKIRILDVERWELERTLEDPAGLGSSIAWSPEGGYLACRAGTRSIKIFTVDDWQLSGTLQGRNEAVSPTWSPDGKYLAALDGTSAGRTNLINIWEFQTGQLTQTISEQIRTLQEVTWSPDGRYLAASEINVVSPRGIIILSVETGNLVTTLLGHTDIITSIQWSPDGRYLASGSYDSTVRLWGERPRD